MDASRTNRPDLLAIIGHTAGGKTTLAAHLALRLGGEVISADSRQVYRRMDIGTGKDLSDYQIGTDTIPYHLIDLVDAGERYSLFDFRRDLIMAYEDIRERGKIPILCGGTGMYLESVLRGYTLPEAPLNPEFRATAAAMTDTELVDLLKSFGPLHNKTDTEDRERLIRAIEVASAVRDDHVGMITEPPVNAKVFAINYSVESRRERITMRLKERLDNGMIDEVRDLLLSVSPDNLMYYGLEYRFITQYCISQITYDQMFASLNTAIHQFAKRQLTWFRGMERRGVQINWIPGELSLENKIAHILENL